MSIESWCFTYLTKREVRINKWENLLGNASFEFGIVRGPSRYYYQAGLGHLVISSNRKDWTLNSYNLTNFT